MYRTSPLSFKPIDQGRHTIIKTGGSMLAKHHGKRIALFFAFILSIFLIGCDKAEDPVSKEDPRLKIVKLTKNNINAYSRQIARNYLDKQKSLLEAYQTAKKNDDVHSFVRFRNQEWSEDYVALRQAYTKVFKLNKEFLKTQPSAPLFGLYENLMYIGLDLKNGLLENDEARQKKAIEAAKQERQMVINIARKLPVEKKVKPKVEEKPAAPMIVN
jgi:hypothetical protein